MMVVPLLCSSFRRPLRQGIRPCGPPTQLYSFFFISQSPQYRVVVFLLGSVIIIVVRFFFLSSFSCFPAEAQICSGKYIYKTVLLPL